MSYGNYMIYSDLRKGVHEITVAKRIVARYHDIELGRAIQIVRQIDRDGPETIVDWENKITGKNALRSTDIAVREHQRNVKMKDKILNTNVNRATLHAYQGFRDFANVNQIDVKAWIRTYNSLNEKQLEVALSDTLTLLAEDGINVV